MQLAATTVNANLKAMDVRPTVFYNFLFSIASAANTLFSCPYKAVQTCSGWKVRLWQGLIIVIFYFCVTSLLMNPVSLSFMSALLVPFFSIALLQLCYGYTWTCLPMLPVCAFQDLTESINVFLPLTLELPDNWKGQILFVSRDAQIQSNFFVSLATLLQSVQNLVRNRLLPVPLQVVF